MRPIYVSVICLCVMSLEVCIREGESRDSLLRRFQRMVQMDGILREAKAHSHFVSKRDAAQIKAKSDAGGDGVRVIPERARK